METSKAVQWFKGHTGHVNCVTFSPDGKQALSGSLDYTMRLWDVETGKELRRFEGNTGGLESAAFSPDSRHILLMSEGERNTFNLRDIEAGKEAKAFLGGPHSRRELHCLFF